MSKENNRGLTFFAISLTIITAGGILWLLGSLIGEAIWLLAKRNSQSATIEIRDNSKRATEKIELNVAGNESFSGYSIISHPEFKKTLAEEYGIKINYQEHDRNKKIDLLDQGELDIWVTTIDRYLSEKPKGKIVGLIDRSVGADAIVLNNQKYSNIESIDDLNNLLRSERERGNKLGLSYANDTTSEYFALVLSSEFEEFNLEYFKIKETETARKTWHLLTSPRENVAVAVLSGPYVTLAKKEGYKILLSSEDAPKSIVHVLVASDRTLEANPEKIIQFLEAYYALIDRNVLEPTQIKEYIASNSKLSLEGAEKILTGIDFFTATEASNWMEDGTLRKQINSIASKLVEIGKIQEIPENSQAFFTSESIYPASINTGKLIRKLNPENPKIAERLAGIGETIAVARQDFEKHQAKEQVNEEEHSHENRDRRKYTIIGAIEEYTDQDLAEFKTTQLGHLKWDGKVTFKYGSAKLDPESSHVLEQVAEKINELNPQRVAVRVIGHTSRTGTLEANQRLSKQRAQVVIDVLQKRGLTHTFIPEGKGYNELLPQYAPDNPKQQRTEIVIERIQL